MPRENRGAYLSDEPNEHGYFEIRWTDQGRSRRKSTGTGDRSVAQRVYAQFLLGGDEEGQDGWKVADILEVYDREKGPTLMGYGMFVSNIGHLNAFFGAMNLAEITTDDVAAYVQDRVAGRISWKDAAGVIRGGRKIAPGSARRELQCLITAANYLVKTKRLAARAVPYIPLPPAQEPRDKWLTREQAARFLEACQPPEATRLTRVYRFAACILYTASRKAVVIKLKWDRVDFEHRYIDFQEPGRRRTRKRRGVVPMSDDLLAIMQRAKAEAIGEWFLDTPTEPYDAFKAAAMKAGVDWLYPHALRHTWATWAAQDGVPLYDIAGVLHDSLATVERVYAHHCPEHLRGAVNRDMMKGRPS